MRNQNSQPINLESIKTTTDISQIEMKKRIHLYEEMMTKISKQKGALSAENKHVISSMLDTINQLIRSNGELRTRNKELSEERRGQSTTGPPHQTYASITSKVKVNEEHVLLIKKDERSEVNLKTELLKKLKPIENEVSIVDWRTKGNTLIVKLKEPTQRETIKEKLKDDAELQCEIPTERVPAIKISEVRREWRETDIQRELRDQESMEVELDKIKILTNPKYYTNKVIVKLKKEDTIRALKSGKLKMGPLLHPIEPDYGIIQCRCCNKYGHFEKDRQGNKTCRGNKKCVHCAGEHDLNDCPTKSMKNRSKCSNCGLNHRAYDKNCSERIRVQNQIKQRFICCD